MKKGIVMLVIIAFMSTGCAAVLPAIVESGLLGTALGGTIGALVTKHNKWKGGVIGAAIGAITGVTLADISARAMQEAIATKKPVKYAADGGGTYQVDPVGYDAKTHCNKIRERIWEGDKLIKDTEKEICESNKTEAGY